MISDPPSYILDLSTTPVGTECLPFSGSTPAGRTLAANSLHLVRDGSPWMPVMGEFHYARHPENEWREELLRMKAGGIDIVSTYVFWIHHEELEGEWDWSGRRNLRRFAELCRETGMMAAVRIGPWCHGEVRNGGIPDWVLEKGCAVRSDDAVYLEKAALLYRRIAGQLDGLLWKQGGPVAIIQIENEYGGPADHLLSLKRLAREAGLDVPFYTRTGWPQLETSMPFGEFLPLFGAYAEGFWDRELTSMPGNYRAAFRFLPVRTDTAIANEQLGPREARDEADAHRYPYLTCELGGGMMSSYHRRIRMEPEDIEAVAIVKIGSGGNMPGYYMYHGGANPAGRLTTLMEAQATALTNWNDLPVRNYDFYAPLGSEKQTRPHYHLLRRLHLWARDFGETAAAMPAVFPAPPDGENGDTLRWSVRSDGTGGYVFVNNHQRGTVLSEKRGVRFFLKLRGGKTLAFPSVPMTVAPGARFVWPFGLDLGYGVRLDHASARLVCRLDSDTERTVFFAETPGVPAEFSFHGELHRFSPGRDACMTFARPDGTVRIVLLSDADSLALWKGRWRGRECVVLSGGDVVFDDDRLRVGSTGDDAGKTDGVYVAGQLQGSMHAGERKGGFTRLSFPGGTGEGGRPGKLVLAPRIVREAGPARRVLPSKRGASPVAEAPDDADFARAAEWRIDISDTILAGAGGGDWLLRLHYRGDVARVLIGGRLVMDDFYNGRPLEIALARHARELREVGGKLRVQILPLRADAPVFMPEDARPESAGNGDPVAVLAGAELVERRWREY